MNSTQEGDTTSSTSIEEGRLVKNIPASYRGFVKNSQALYQILRAKFNASSFSSLSLELDSCSEVVIGGEASQLFDLLSFLKEDRELVFDFLIDITTIDWLDSKKERFEIVYHLQSIKNLYRLRIKAYLAEAKPEVRSVTSLWKSANFLEREVWDMYGIIFIGHPDLRRLLMYEEFIGHPLRKDYPIQKKQPRVKLRYPEVRNTAMDMKRHDLVQINRGTIARKERKE
jgi:NADH-quinone oxidoreductase subunit C